MIYLDTSFLAPLFREEATSTKVAAFLGRQSVGTLAVSKWASVEFASLISRDARMGALTVAQGRKLIAEFDAMVADAPKFAEVANDFLEFIGDAVLVAHNSPFDMKFLDHEIGRIYHGYRIANPNLCTVQLSRKLVPNIENHKLKTVAEHFCVDLTNHHRAACDANATAKIFIELLTKLDEKGVNDLAGARKVKI